MVVLIDKNGATRVREAKFVDLELVDMPGRSIIVGISRLWPFNPK